MVPITAPGDGSPHGDRPIEDYGLVGDTRSAALAAKADQLSRR